MPMALPTNLYLGIDGVLLGKTDPASPRTALANHAREFLDFALANLGCYGSPPTAGAMPGRCDWGRMS
jgi:hypothetical protein